MEFGMSRRIKPKNKYVCITMKEIWRNWDGPPKIKELWSYVVSFVFSRPKVAQMVNYLMYGLNCITRIHCGRLSYTRLARLCFS